MAVDGEIVAETKGDLATSLCNLIERHGLAGLATLRGAYSVALWTGRQLILARDPAGRLPLHYRQDGDGLLFSSTPAAIGSKTPLATDWAARQLLLLPDRDRETAYLGVCRVLPGEVLAFETPVGAPERWRWSPDFDNPLTLSTSAAAAQAERLIDEALERIDAKASRVAMQFSSGLDSAVLLSRLGRKDVDIDCYTASPVVAAGASERMDDEWLVASRTGAAFPRATMHRVQGPTSGLHETVRSFDLFQQPTMNMCNIGWIDALAARASADGHSRLIEGLAGNFTLTHVSGGRLCELAARRAWGDFMLSALRKKGQGTRTALRRNPPPAWKRRRSRSQGRHFMESLFLRSDSELLNDQLEAERAMDRSPERVDAIDCPERRYFEFLQHRDDALFRYAMRERHGVLLHDPFADADVMDFAFRLTAEAFGPEGSRALGYALLDDRLDVEAVRQGARASQGDNWRVAAERDLVLATELLDWAHEQQSLRDMVDLPAARLAVEAWPVDGWDDADQVDRYRSGLMRTLGLIAFARWMEDGR